MIVVVVVVAVVVVVVFVVVSVTGKDAGKNDAALSLSCLFGMKDADSGSRHFRFARSFCFATAPLFSNNRALGRDRGVLLGERSIEQSNSDSFRPEIDEESRSAPLHNVSTRRKVFFVKFESHLIDSCCFANSLFRSLRREIVCAQQ